MVHFMLDAYGQRALYLDDDLFTTDVLSFYLDRQRAGDVGIQAGKRQAAFLVDLRAGLFENLRIDQCQRLVAVITHVGDQHALVHVDLGRSQSNAVGVVHGFEQVGDELLQLGVKHGDRLSAGAQAWIGEFDDGK
jgi:hypothetical protein